ncbi:hypothetical protein WR25_17880 [Diploscapter pachys]|uniref:CAP-Gly domain-containing protein n=1 Tax=Diploscapter pachys TaxID=2018661 RepID=A0A2A2JSP9_9BILA|nr:hypothetical protein WR25_17880 [Diploscapter pachys]
MVSIGIDLGTTYSCVAIIENGRPVAIHNDDGRNTLPSVVAFSDEETLVGNSALDSSTDMANILYGGQDFDSRIMKFVIDEFNKSSPDYDIYKKPRLLKRLRTECREAKESLSFSNNPANVHLDINDDLEMNVRLTKEKFHELCSDLFEKAMILVDRALNMAQLSPEKIGHVILVGGSTRIPQIKQNINNKFRNSKIQFDINPDEAIAHGAAIVANDKNVYPSKILMHGHSISAQFPVSNFDRSAPRQTRVISVEKEDSPKSLFSSSSSFLPTSFFPNSSQQENVSYATTSVDDPMLRQRVSVGDRCICNGHPCTVRFIGYLKGHASIYAGVEFDDKVGEGTGEFEGETVFCTPNGYAGFVILSGLKVFRT